MCLMYVGFKRVAPEQDVWKHLFSMLCSLEPIS